MENGFVFNDLLTDYERISDHCSNVAVDILESGEVAGAHELQNSLEYRQNEAYTQLFNEYKEKYAI